MDSQAKPGSNAPDLYQGLEPVPGYRLIQRLGAGGFGEVWKAEGQGGFWVALKFVRLDGAAGSIEMRALDVLRTIRHPNLLSSFGAWQQPPFLMIAMELADCTLRDRLIQSQEQGLRGIPQEELVEYVAEAAKGIDHLNEHKHSLGDKEGVGVQHRDIKPENIPLVGNGVKVADFGLVRLLEKSVAGHTGAMTVAYAPPEFFSDRTSNHSDQYSLAVTYCELRGGRLPFTGNLAQVMAGHLTRLPDLSMLPSSEWPPIQRAMAKDPKQRWPSCKAFVEALRACPRTRLVASVVGIAARAPAPSPVATTPEPVPRAAGPRLQERPMPVVAVVEPPPVCAPAPVVPPESLPLSSRETAQVVSVAKNTEKHDAPVTAAKRGGMWKRPQTYVAIASCALAIPLAMIYFGSLPKKTEQAQQETSVNAKSVGKQ